MLNRWTLDVLAVQVDLLLLPSLLRKYNIFCMTPYRNILRNLRRDKRITSAMWPRRGITFERNDEKRYLGLFDPRLTRQNDVKELRMLALSL